MELRPIAVFVIVAFGISGIATATGHAEESSLADAVESGDSNLMVRLIEGGADVNAAQVDGMTALHWAVYHDDTETVELLAQSGANANAKNRYGVVPLLLAAENANDLVVQFLLDAGADPNTVLRGGETILMTVARTGSLGAVKALLAKGANPKAKDGREQTALMWAAAEGHARVVKALIDAGADIDNSLSSGFTPMFFAVREGHVEVVQEFLRAGIDANEILQRVEDENERPEYASYRPVDDGMSPLLLAVRNGHFELAVALVKAGADPNDMRTGFTPLHTVSWVRKPDASDRGDPPPVGSGALTSLEFVRAMVALGADVNARLAPETDKPPHTASRLAREGSTAFLMAADRADAALMQTLIDLGADPDLPNSENTTPLMAAAGLGTTAPAEEAGTELDAQQAVRLLLELGADIDGVDRNGDTAVHGAAYGHFPTVVQLLSDYGADIDVWTQPNDAGLTTLFVAEGYRKLGFKPSRPTVAVVKALMDGAGVETDGPRPEVRDMYDKKLETPK